MLTVEAISLASLIFWIVLSLDWPRSWPTEAVLPVPSASQPPNEGGSVIAIVPARNEAETLQETLPALLKQSDPSLRVILVDDGSTDRTREVAENLARELGLEERLQVVSAGPKLAGWSGKVHAQLCGYVALLERAVHDGLELPEWLLLTDADIRHRQGSVQSLLLQAEGAQRRGFDLVSVMARLKAQSPWERLIVPAFVFFFQLLYPFRRVANPRSRVAAAAGGCVLVRRIALEEAGGFAAFGGEIIDDVALGRVIKKAHGGVWLGLDPGIESVRGYERLADLWRMVSRTAFTQLRHRWDLLLLTVLALGVFLVSPPLVITGCLFALGGAEVWEVSTLWRCMGWSSLAWAFMTWRFMPAVRYHRVPSIYAATLPLAALMFGLMTVSSAWQELRGKGPSWRGRDYGPSGGTTPPSSR